MILNFTFICRLFNYFKLLLTHYLENVAFICKCKHVLLRNWKSYMSNNDGMI